MKALILAAGETREDHGFPKNYKPKCLLKYEGEVVLERNAKLLRKYGINDVIVVVGYKASQVREFAKERKLGLKFVYNPDFSDENSLDSFLLGLKELAPDDSFIWCHGDVLLSEEVLENLLKCKSKLCIRRYGEEPFVAKLTKKALGNLKDMEREILSYREKWSVKVRVLNIGEPFCQYLLRRGAESVKGKVMEIDYFDTVNIYTETDPKRGPPSFASRC